MFEKLLKEKLKKFKKLFGKTDLEKELLPLQGEEIKIKKKKED